MKVKCSWCGGRGGVWIYNRSSNECLCCRGEGIMSFERFKEVLKAEEESREMTYYGDPDQGDQKLELLFNVLEIKDAVKRTLENWGKDGKESAGLDRSSEEAS